MSKEKGIFPPIYDWSDMPKFLPPVRKEGDVDSLQETKTRLVKKRRRSQNKKG